MTIYDARDRAYARNTWAGFNKIMTVIVLGLLVFTLLGFMWDGETLGIILLKIDASVFLLDILSVGVYCINYRILF